MCKINVKTNLSYVNIHKHKYEKNITRLYGVRLKEMMGLTFLYTHLGT